jgi:crotonobetainyl-CoA:carnitine CoA-transferase CaiB-like acyl-CoA transferase
MPPLEGITVVSLEQAVAYPRLIVCNLSGYGSSGPYRNKKAYDLLAQCEAGLISITGTPETPCKLGVSIADIANGEELGREIEGAFERLSAEEVIREAARPA